jgi:general stress protein YciG
MVPTPLIFPDEVMNMADKGQPGFAGMDEERHREVSQEGGHASHDKGNAHEFDREEASEAGRKGAQVRQMAHASRETAGGTNMPMNNQGRSQEGGEQNNGGIEIERTEQSSAGRTKKTRGGTHDQHVTAGKKGGSRIRELIELGYKYEEEHGIGPGRNDRSKLAARRRTTNSSGPGDEGDEGNEAAAETGA